MTRIIAGEFRRRKLRTNEGLVTRPITDRMKETLFQHLGDLEGLRVADVFAGTGTLGLEALSRGATTAVFIEKDRRAAELLRDNIVAVGADKRSFCWRVDVRRTSFRPRGLDAFLPYTLVFFDPPYRMVDELDPRSPLGKSLARLARSEITAEDARLVLRTPVERSVPVPEPWVCEQTLKMASSEIRICRRTVADGSDENDGDENEAERGGTD